MYLLGVLIERTTQSLNRPFYYSYSGNKNVGVGYRVVVNFASSLLVGYVISCEVKDKSSKELEEDLGFSIKEINDVLDIEPLLSDELVKLSDEMSSYYLAAKISILQTMLPPSLKPALSSLKAPQIAFDLYLIAIDLDEEGLTGKQIEILRLINQEKAVLKRDIKNISVVKSLILKGKIQIIKKEKSRLTYQNYTYVPPKELTSYQKKAIEKFKQSDKKVILLQGVTGSGKTEVYLKLTEDTLKEGKNVIMLVPEISLTPFMVQCFISRFGKDVAVFHSELTAGQKYDEYRKVASGKARIVVGARSAIFAPLSNIGLVIIDEEHSESYKQDNTPFYHAREVAIMRVNHFRDAKLLLGSATPCLETKSRALKGVYDLIEMPIRINEKELPKTSVVDLLNPENFYRESVILSKLLINSIKEKLDKHQQVVLLMNRRGHSTYISCRDCGSVIRCPNCGLALTYHKKDNMLKCHHCDYVTPMIDTCPKCGSSRLSKTGFGTEKIEEEIHKLFPQAITVRLDSDSSKIKNNLVKSLETFRKHEADILIGTQMISKGHDFKDVTLVGVVLADIGLSIPNFRSTERIFELITQAVGRSGRGEEEGEAIIQTYVPTHYAIITGAKQDYEKFYLTEMQVRKMSQTPPYTYLLQIEVSGKNEENVVKTIYNLGSQLKSVLGTDAKVIGPIAPYVAKENDINYRRLLLKFKKPELNKPKVWDLCKNLASKSAIKVKINVDPYNF